MRIFMEEINEVLEEPVETVLRLVYSSRALVPFDSASLTELLQAARVNNERCNVSGMLLYADGTFLQVLEGDEEVVESLFAVIESDTRHDETRVLLRVQGTPRSFGDWTMGFVSATREMIDSVEGLNGFLQSATGMPEHTQDATERILKILDQFKSGQWRREIEG